MTITDEILSAFIDAELCEADMESVREAIVNDITLADRLSALAYVDMAVNAAADKATQKPLPRNILAMVTESGLDEKAQTVISMTPRAAKPKQTNSWSFPVSMAASIALLAGLVFFQADITRPSNVNSLASWDSISAALEGSLTGQTFTTETGSEITPQLSFVSHQSGFCRQVEFRDTNELNVIIACKNQQGEWQPSAAKRLLSNGAPNSYQTASANKVLESELDKLMTSAPLNREEEQQAIKHQWRMNKTHEGATHEN